MDEGADRRRIRRLVAMLRESGGDLPVELSVRTRSGRVVRLTLPGVADAEPLLPRIRTLLGVLGEVAEHGTTSAVPASAASAAPRGGEERLLAAAR